MESFDWLEYAFSAVDIAGRRLIRLLGFVPLGLLFEYLYTHRLFNFESNSALAFTLLFLGVDFLYYWGHRWFHEVRWFWAHHSVHHSPPRLNFLAAFRNGWFGNIGQNMVFLAPMAYLGFEPQLVFATMTLNQCYQYFVHSEWIPKIPAIEGILNTASAHRVHHSTEAQHLYCNYGGILIIYDRLFGTYISEPSTGCKQYGWVTKVPKNILVYETYEWIRLFKDLYRARNISEWVCYLFKKPDWSPKSH